MSSLTTKTQFHYVRIAVFALVSVFVFTFTGLIADLITDKTIFGANLESIGANFTEGVFLDTEFDSSLGGLVLDSAGLSAGTGSYISKAEEAGESINWNTISWSPLAPYGMELPAGASTETGFPTSNVDMSGNVLLFNFNEQSGSILDHSGNSNNGTYSGTSYEEQGVIDRAVGFDSGAEVIVPDSPELNPNHVSVAAWVRWEGAPSTADSWTTILAKNNDNQYRLQHNNTNTAFEFAVRTSSGTRFVLSTTEPQVGEWYHLVGSYDGSEVRLYVNGELEASQGHSGNINTSGADIHIGNRGMGARAFPGLIDELAIWDRSISSAEVSAVYQRAATEVRSQVQTCAESTCASSTSSDFVGPDGTSSSYYTAAAALAPSSPEFNLPSSLGQSQYLRYRAELSSMHGNTSPLVQNVRVDGDPGIIQLQPSNNSTNVPLETQLVVSFDEEVYPIVGGEITVRDASDDSIHEVIAINSSDITGLGSDTVIINRNNSLSEGNQYYVQISPDTFQDSDGNSYQGITTTTTWSFTAFAPATPPSPPPAPPPTPPVTEGEQSQPGSTATTTTTSPAPIIINYIGESPDQQNTHADQEQDQEQENEAGVEAEKYEPEARERVEPTTGEVVETIIVEEKTNWTVTILATIFSFSGGVAFDRLLIHFKLGKKL